MLPRLFHEVLVPEAVWAEIIAGGADDAAARGLGEASWARRTPAEVSDPVIVEWNLGAGESEVLSVALSGTGRRTMVDDAAARACARTLGIPILGTGGALVLAKRRGIISSVSIALRSLQDAGLWLSNDLVRLLKQQAGE